jgi:hypothetical protein
MVGGGEITMISPGGVRSISPSCGSGVVTGCSTVGGPCALITDCASGTTTGTYTILGLAGKGSMGMLTTKVGSPSSITATRNVEELLKLGNAGIAPAGIRRCVTSFPFNNLVSSG